MEIKSDHKDHKTETKSVTTGTPKKVTIHTLLKQKRENQKTVFITAYDFPTARFCDDAGVDMILVGDSLGMTMLGYSSTLPVTMEDMVRHCSAVCRGVNYAFVVGDMPFLSYQTSKEQAVLNAGRLIQTGCTAVKCEGGRGVADKIKAMTDAGILVMGHLGLTPQSMAALGGYRVQGKTDDAIKKIIDEALAIKEAGVFSILIEAVPADAGNRIREALGDTPIYGIGAGPHVDGQLLISHDLLGTFAGTLNDKGSKIPKFAKRYANIGELVVSAVKTYSDEVRTGKFPGPEHCYE